MEKGKDIKEKTEKAKMVSRAKAKQRVANNIAILRLSFRSREGSRGLAIPKEKIKTVTKEKDMAESQILAERGRRLAAGHVVATIKLRIAGRISMFEMW